MVERGGQRFRASAVALIHADYVHPEGESLGGNPPHVVGIAGTLEAMHQDDRQRVLAVFLPVTVSQDFDARLYLDQARLGGWKDHASRQEKIGQSLLMSTAQAASRDKSWSFGLRNLHNLILNGDGGETRRQEE